MALGNIIAIEEVAELLAKDKYSGGHDGYKVETSKHVYLVLINNYQNCYENWGYMTSDDDLQSHIGEELLEVRIVDIALNRKKLEEIFPYGSDEVSTMFVDFVTDKGVFQLAVYNSHNGYYGHRVMVVKDSKVIEESYI